MSSCAVQSPSIHLFTLHYFLQLQAAPAPSPKVVVKEEEEDDDIDLFGSDEEDEEAERIKAQRVQEYAAKKAKKPALIAKSSIILDVKPVSTLVLTAVENSHKQMQNYLVLIINYT